METLKVNKVFDTYEEKEKYAKEISEKYIIMAIIEKPQNASGQEIYGIDEIWHFGERK